MRVQRRIRKIRNNWSKIPPDDQQVVDQIEAELKADDAADEWTRQSWEDSASAELDRIIGGITTTTNESTMEAIAKVAEKQIAILENILGSKTPNSTALTISYKQLHNVLSGEQDEVDQATIDTVLAIDITAICAESDMGEGYVGGDDVVSIVNDVLQAQKDGYSIVTWYGPDAEVLIVGVRGGTLNLT